MTATTDEAAPEGAEPAGASPAGAEPSKGSREPTAQRASRPHFPCFEGLRALAAVMIVVHHAAATAGNARAGFLATPAAVMDSGVAIFFVISGFLIYRPFVVANLVGVAPMPTGSFLWRRLLRVVPAYWVALSFFWAMGAFSLGTHWWRYYLFVNLYWRNTVFHGIVQAWSLSTELIFYLLIPVWAFGMRRLLASRPKRARAPLELAACAVLYAAGFAVREVISIWDPAWRAISWVWFPTNIDLFAMGMALAVISAWAASDPRVRSLGERAVRLPALWWAAGIGLFAWYAYRVGPVDFNGGYRGFFWERRQLIDALVAAALLLPAIFGPQDRGLVRRTLRWRPIAWVGVVSYGLYLWHFDWMQRITSGRTNAGTSSLTGAWPGWVHAAPGNSNVVVLLAAGLGLGLLFAALSWELVEKPLQRFKFRTHRGSA